MKHGVVHGFKTIPAEKLKMEEQQSLAKNIRGVTVHVFVLNCLVFPQFSML